MSTIQRSRTVISGFIAVLTFALSAPIAVHAEEQAIAEEKFVAEDQTFAAEAPVITLAPDAGPSCDDTTGYCAVEASRS